MRIDDYIDTEILVWTGGALAILGYVFLILWVATWSGFAWAAVITGIPGIIAIVLGVYFSKIDKK